MEQFARVGHRTLCVAYRNISNEEYAQWLPKYYAAQTTLEKRDVIQRIFLEFSHIFIIGKSN